MELKQVIFLFLLGGFGVALVPLLMTRRYKTSWGLALLFVFLFFNKDINLFFHPYRGTSTGFSIGLLDVVLLGLFLRHIRNVRIFSPMVGFQILFLGWSCLGLFVAQRADFVAFELFKYFKALGFYVVVSAMLESLEKDELRQRLLQWWMAVAALQIMYGFLQYIQGVYRLNGSLPHSNDLSIVLNMLLPVLFASLFLPAQWIASGLRWWCFLGSAACVIMTRSRAGWASMAVGIFLIAAAMLFRMVWNGIRGRAHDFPLARLLMTGALIGFLGTVGVAKFLPSMLARIAEAPKSSAESRKHHNKEALIMAQENIVGVGLNNYVLTTITRFNKPADGVDTTVAHHLFYLTAAEAGFVGLFLFLLMPFWGFVMGIRSLFHPQGLLAAAMMAGAGMAMFQSMFEPVLRHVTPLYLWLLAMAWTNALLRSQPQALSQPADSASNK